MISIKQIEQFSIYAFLGPPLWYILTIPSGIHRRTGSAHLCIPIGSDFNLSKGCFPIFLRIFYKFIQKLYDF